MSDSADISEVVGEELNRLCRIMDRIIGCADPGVVSTGLAAVDAILLREPRLRQLPHLIEVFDSLGPLKEELRARALAQRVLNAASAPTPPPRKRHTPMCQLIGARKLKEKNSSPQSLSTWVSGTKKHSANVGL